MARALTSIERESKVFVDSNIFTYFLLEDERYFENVMSFFDKINDGVIVASVNIIVFTETLFNFVKAKVIIEENIRQKDFMKIVKAKPELIAKVDISPVLELFSLPNLVLLDLPPNFIDKIVDIHRRYGLLSNDAYHLLTMRYYGVNDIATNDSDFERVESLNVWMP